ncbi:hypothetical protein GXP67_23785 [Rhodocytophaga rosea]|uniref:Uncharacterized protein n=1 Tax=Rhodocytophaga rosea TaxID=2704465 RepID=A0A6C0GN33_9BACT|nr:hypothetical protein [Rhodocytophaga rosea]QHT69446.1 hypothetical protein GXP67_23785 [Rhodocytophaga rosea]
MNIYKLGLVSPTRFILFLVIGFGALGILSGTFKQSLNVSNEWLSFIWIGGMLSLYFCYKKLVTYQASIQIDDQSISINDTLVKWSEIKSYDIEYNGVFAILTIKPRKRFPLYLMINLDSLDRDIFEEITRCFFHYLAGFNKTTNNLPIKRSNFYQTIWAKVLAYILCMELIIAIIVFIFKFEKVSFGMLSSFCLALSALLMLLANLTKNQLKEQ